ncbi:MAG: cell division protein FtsZ [Pseudomonadota bacterium]
MSINIGPPATEDLRPKITVVGIGGAGGNAIANMIDSEIEGVDFIVANTDAQALASSPAEKRIQLGPDITGGLGAGARPEVGKAAAEETVAEIEDMLDGVNMVFIAAGMGGGTGTGAAPVIAEAARRKGVLTVGVVTKPFLFEGTRRMRAAEAGIIELQDHVDTLIVIPNQNLFLVAKPETTFKEAFQLADEVLQQGVRSITDLIVNPGLINLDFADIRAVMSEMGKAMMGTGEGEGENRALFAAEQAIANPLLDGVSMQGAKGVIISIIGGEDMTLMELDEAANYIRDLVDEDANIIWGSAFNPEMDNKIRISVVATGIEASSNGDAPARPAALAEPRAPKRPVLELSDEESSAEAPAVPPAVPSFDDLADEEPFGDTDALETAEGDALTVDPSTEELSDLDEDDSFSDEPMELGAEEEVEDDTEDNLVEPFDLTGMQAGDEMGEHDDDVDEIIDPLAGLRSAEEDEGFEDASDGLLDDADQLVERDEPVELSDNSGRDEVLDSGTSDDAAAQGGAVAEGMGGGPSGGEGVAQQGAGQDGSSGAPSGAGLGTPGLAGSGAAAAAGGSTLFERMANLSRSSGSEAEDEEEEDADDGEADDAPALSIPRFLGRQNNQ